MQEDMLVEADHLPRGMRIIGEVMSCLAVSQYGWTRVPAVALHGRVTLTPEGACTSAARQLDVRMPQRVREPSIVHAVMRTPTLTPRALVLGWPAALAAAEALGIPISPSMEGPFEEEVATQLAVFLKGCKYPDTKAFIM